MRRLKRAGLPLAAQILFTLAQVSVTVAGSATLHPDDWGRFALLLSVFFIAMAFVRGFSSLPVLVFLSGDEVQARSAKRAASLVGLMATAPAFVALLVAGALVGAPDVGALLGVSLVSYSLYDTARAVELASGAFRRIVGADAVLLAILAGGSAVSFLPGAAPGVVLPLAMLGAYAVGAAVLAIGRRASSHWTLRMFISEYSRDLPFLAVDSALLASVLGSFVIITGTTSSLSEAGAFRTCITLLVGPLQAVQSSISPLAIRSLRQSAKQSAAAPGADTRRVTLGPPVSFAAAGLAAGAVYGLLVSLAAAALLLLIELPVIATAVPYAFGGSVLVSALWASSIFSSFMRYRRPNSELTVARLTTLTASLSAFAVCTIVFDAGLSTALLISAIPLLVIPAAHTLARWAPVARSFAPPRPRTPSTSQTHTLES